MNMKDEVGFTPLRYAARNNHIEVVKLLVEIRCTLEDDPLDSRRRNFPLSEAAKEGHFEVVKCLVRGRTSRRETAIILSLYIALFSLIVLKYFDI